MNGISMTVRFGTIGSAGESVFRTLPSPSDATRERDRMITERIKMGYQLV